MLTGEIGSMFAARTMPNDYKILQDFISKQPEYFRTYWAPRDSRWGIYTNSKPKVSGAAMIQGDWKKLVDFD